MTVENAVPGPGQYSPKPQTSDKSYSVPKARRHSLYDVPLGSDRDSKNPNDKSQAVPGPGAYNVDMDIGGPKYGTSRALRYFNKKHASPGPGAYDIKPEHDAPRYTMNSRKSQLKKDENPGPGTYSPTRSFTSIHYSIGKSKHFEQQIKNVPGPGAYVLGIEKTYSYSIGNSKRPPLSLVLDTPGPGSYNCKNAEKAPSYTMSKKNQIIKLDSDPVRNI